MNDHLPNGTLDDLTLDSAPLDLGSFDGFDPFAGTPPPQKPRKTMSPPCPGSGPLTGPKRSTWGGGRWPE